MTSRLQVGVLAAALALAPAARGEIAPPETTEVFVGSGEAVSGEFHALAHRFVLDGRAVVTRGGATLAPEVDYRLDPDAGVLQLARPLAEGERVTIAYAWLPVDLPRDIAALERAEPTPPDSTRIAPDTSLAAADRLARAVDADLAIDGAKTLAIEAGTNRDATVEQSLRVSVTGRIGEDARLTALLSDQNIPLQPEGNTQRLEELDEILVQIESKKGAATLGDFVARREGSAFGDFDRRLSGAEAWVARGSARVRGVGASTRGTFRSVEFRGVDGKQGPYVLAGQGPDPTGVIVAGSERVWIDGRPLTRGESQDYVIDYSRGEVEFTNRRVVTAQSEIAVDFEVAEQPYKRSFFLGETSYGTPGEGLAWRAGMTAERDGDEPRDVSLTDERRAALAAAGDSAVLVPGAVCGLENGDYREEGDHFVWARPDSGTCNVSFTFVGAGRGDYVRDRDADLGAVFFRFVGAAQGDYTPGLSLAPPRSLTLADFSASAGGAEGLSLHADGALSREDRNTLSGKDDGDDDGAAGRAELAYRSGELARWGGPVKVDASGSFRGQAAEFTAPGRTRAAYLGEVWNFADTTRADETVSEVSTTVSAGERWSAGGGFGVLDRAGRFRSTRHDVSASWAGRRVPTARGRVEWVRREDDADSAGTVVGDLRRERGDVVTAFGPFRPGVAWWREDREDDRAAERLSGQDDAEIAGTLAFDPGRIGRGDVRIARRTTDLVEGGRWLRDSVGRTVELRGEVPGRRARARVSWIRRDVDFEAGRPSPDVTTDLARADLAHESLGGVVSGEYVYQTTSKSFTDLLAGPGAAEEPTLALEASARVVLAGAPARSRAGGSSSGRLSWFRAETYGRVEEQTSAPDRGPIYRLDFSRFQDDVYTVFGSQLVREEVTLLPGAGALSLTGRWERTRTKDARAASAPLDLDSERRVLRMRNRLDVRWTLESQGTWQEDSRGDARTGVADFDVRLLELREALVWQPQPSSRLSGTGAIVSERDELRRASIRGVLAGLGAQSGVRGAGRAQADLTWTHPTDVQGVDVGQRFRTRPQDQWEWRGTLEIKASDAIHVSVSYSGRAVEGSPPLHFARAEARALF
jgi:hypothetical protein